LFRRPKLTLSCSAEKSLGSQPTFREYKSPLYSAPKNKPNMKPAEASSKSTTVQLYIPEDRKGKKVKLSLYLTN
jgi:hypothetical protein